MPQFVHFFLLAVVFGCAAAYPNGTVTGACDNLTPRHGNFSLIDEAGPVTPYELIATRTSPNDTFKVTLRGLGPDDFFKGFMVQAREEDGTTPIGTFSLLEEYNDVSQLLTCKNPGVSRNSILLLFLRVSITNQLSDAFLGCGQPQDDQEGAIYRFLSLDGS